MNAGGALIDTTLARPGDIVICNFVLRPWIKAIDSKGRTLDCGSG